MGKIAKLDGSEHIITTTIDQFGKGTHEKYTREEFSKIMGPISAAIFHILEVQGIPTVDIYS